MFPLAAGPMAGLYRLRECQKQDPMSAGLMKVQEWEQVAKAADFSPSRMAAHFAISGRQLQRIFKRRLQRTPRQWLRELQCRLARELIARGYSTKAAASELKFASESQFCREFKKAFGASPQRFAPNHFASLVRPLAVVENGLEPAGEAANYRAECKTGQA